MCAAVDVPTVGPVNVCSTYVPPRQYKHLDDFAPLMTNATEHTLLCGDFNAPHPHWCRESTTRHDDLMGTRLARTFEQSPLDVLNDGTATHEPTNADQHEAALDVAFATQRLAARCSCAVDTGSPLAAQHIPAIVDIHHNPAAHHEQQKKQQWRIRTADNESYAERVDELLSDYTDKFPMHTDQRHATSDVANRSTVNDATTTITSAIIAAAAETVGKHNRPRGKKAKRWWSTSLKRQRLRLKSLRRRLWKTRRQTDRDAYYDALRHYKRSIKKEKRDALLRELTRISKATTNSTMFSLFTQAVGEAQNSSAVHALKRPDGSPTQDPLEKADMLTTTYARASADEPNPKFDEPHRREVEQFLLTHKHMFTPNSHCANSAEQYNRAFTMDDLEQALKRTREGATGEDDVHIWLINNVK